jgi:hypothetical protein
MNILNSYDIEHLLWLLERAETAREKEQRKTGVKFQLSCNTCDGIRSTLLAMQAGVEAMEAFRDKQWELTHNHEG